MIKIGNLKTSALIKTLIVTLIFLVVWNLPISCFGIPELTVIQQRIIAIFVFATLAWVLEIMPPWATSVAAIGLLLVFTSDSGLAPMSHPEKVGALLSYGTLMATFADPVIMLFIGAFILAIAADKTGLDAYLAKRLLAPFGNKSENLLLGFILITGFFSMFISDTATTAMMLTFLGPVFRQLADDPKGRIAMALSVPIASCLGGMGTPIGTPPNSIALKYLNDPQGLNMGIGFGEWIMFMAPMVVLLLFVEWFVLMKLFPFRQKTIKFPVQGELKRGFLTTVVIITFIVTIGLWLLDSVTGLNSYTVAFIPVVVFGVTGVITSKDLERIHWAIIWMVAGGFALGYALNGSGLAALAIDRIPFGEFSPLVILLIAVGICYSLSNFISNSATAALLMPILSTICLAMGDKLAVLGGPATVLISVSIAASSAMVLPISTPSTALAFGTGYMTQRQMATVGLIVGLITLVFGISLLYIAGRLSMP